MVLNLRVDSEEARLVGAETHVAELQLLLLAFAEIKVARPHTTDRH